MNTQPARNPARQITTASLVVGAVAFGMVLAGGLKMTPTSQSAAAPLAASQVAGANIATHALPSFADLAEAVDPAVVSIQASTISKGGDEDGQRGGGVDPFEFFFPNNPRNPRQQRPQAPRGDGPERRQDAGGSGFVVSPDGLIVTNNHVIDGATSVRVHLGDRDYPAEVKGTDPSTDLALLKIDAGHSLRYLELGDSDKTRVGDWVMVIGNPLNLDKTVTTGVVSAKGRSIGINPDSAFENFIQTDAAINFGNSGGPVVDMDGRVIGIATAINAGAENIGFAVPVSTLQEVLPQLRDKGKVIRGYLGVQIQNLNFETAQSFGLDTTDGALVGRVEDDTPAAEAGLKHGDVLLSVDGRKIKTTRDLIDYVANKGPNTKVKLVVLRDGKQIDKVIKLGERPGQIQQASNDKPKGRSGIGWLGIQYQDLTGGLRNEHGLPKDAQGVWVTDVNASSPLYEKFVRPGDLITEVNGRPVDGTNAFEKAIGEAKPGTFVRLYVLRFGGQNEDGQPFFAVVRVP
ncbi:MAG: Do family serine endopeptidase [Acidobacteriota bacterium]